MDAFTTAYIEAALWSSMDNADEQGGEPLDANYDIEDIAPEAIVFLKLAKEDANPILRRLIVERDRWDDLVQELIDDKGRAFYIVGEEQDEVEANGYFIY